LPLAGEVVVVIVIVVFAGSAPVGISTATVPSFESTVPPAVPTTCEIDPSAAIVREPAVASLVQLLMSSRSTAQVVIVTAFRPRRRAS
jgi:hypothetical protein